MLLVVAACGPDGRHGRVKGNIDGINEADIIAYVEDVDPAKASATADDNASDALSCTDSIKMKRGSFSYDRAITQPTILTLLYPNFSTTSLVIEPGKTVKIKGDGNRLGELEVDGNEDNNFLTEFRKHTAGKRDAEVKREAATFIRTHAKTLAAVVLFRDYFATAEVIEANPTESLLAELQKAQPKSTIIKRMAERLKPLLANAPGKKLPSFTGPNFEGGVISSSSYAGKNLLIVFFAQWDGSFYTMKRSAKELDSSLDAGDLSFLFVSLDTDRKVLENATNYDKLPGKIIYDGKSFGSPLVEKLGMRYIGGSVLVGPDGTIIDRDIPHKDWKNRIPSLLR